MKASIITLTSVRNYGTQLQALATQEKLSEFYDEVELINYCRPDTYGRGLLKAYAKGNPIRGAAIVPTMVLWHFKFGKFQREYLHLTKHRYETNADFEQYPQDADIYFTGSDQVWNSGWNGGIIPFLYLSFIQKDKIKAAFSSSFGRSTLSDDEVKACKPYFDQFAAISVREESGKTILNNQFHYDNVTRLVDPTLAMPPEYWRGIEPSRKIQDDYILIYCLNNNPSLDHYAKKFSARTGLPAYRFCTRLDQMSKFGQSLLVPDILDFVSFIDHAKYVITDSFHATAFSMNLNTEVVCILPGKYSGRLTEFLSLIHEESRVITDYSDFRIVNTKPDFVRVNQILDAERIRINDFLASLPQK